MDNLNETITEIKIILTKHESNQERMNEILAKLTQSVEYHIKRSDNLEELVSRYKADSDIKLTEQMQTIKTHIDFVKGAAYTVGLVVTAFVMLHQMGILQKLI
jgi:predicted component of type VI protein secretion system